MSKSPAFRLYASDFYMDTITWTNEEIGVYLRLLLSQWVNGPLQKDEKKLAKIAKISPKKFQKVFPVISHKFKEKGENEIYNERLEHEREKQLNYKKLLSEAGKKGAKKKLENSQKNDSHPIIHPIDDPGGHPFG